MDMVGLRLLLAVRLYAGSTVPLAALNRYHMRAERTDSLRVVNVFDGAGTQVYTIERLSSYNPVWSLLTYPQRHEVATVGTSVFGGSVDFHNKPGMTHRAIASECGLGGCFQSFFTTDGVKYSWNRHSRYLEKVVNPNAGSEEIRTQIARARLMRQFKLDFEVLVDETAIDREVVLATAFVSVLTQWGYGDFTDTVGPTALGAGAPGHSGPSRASGAESGHPGTSGSSGAGLRPNDQPLVVVVNSENLRVEEVS